MRITTKQWEWLAVAINLPAAALVALNLGPLWTWTGFVLWTLGAIPLYIWKKEKGGRAILILAIVYAIIDGIGVIRWWPF